MDESNDYQFVGAGDGEDYENIMVDSARPISVRRKFSGSYVPELFGGIAESSLPSFEQQALLYKSRIIRDSNARKFLAKLYERRILTENDIGADCTWLDSVTIARLSAAQFCDVDERAVRLTDYGAKFVEELLELAQAWVSTRN